jgi:LacI family transcriptional regulator
VAREAGVSTATVSRVIHGLDRVRPSTRQRVLDVISALGFIPDGAAQSLARHRKEVIGLVGFKCPGPGTDVEQDGLLFLDEVMRGAEASLTEIGWSLLISVLARGGDVGDPAERLRKIAAKVDGLIIAEGTVVGPDQLAVLAARIPIVLVAGRPGQAHADVIHADNRAGTSELVRHLVEQHGRTRLYYVSGPLEAPDADERLAAFEAAVASYPGVRVTGSSEGLFTALSGQVAVREMLSGPAAGRPDAMVCGNDQMAIGAIRELQTAGLRVPDDIAVAGFDDIQTGALLSVPLTTVHQPMQKLGERACARLLERIADPGLPLQVERLPAPLVIRESCGCPGPRARSDQPRADRRLGVAAAAVGCDPPGLLAGQNADRLAELGAHVVQAHPVLGGVARR